MAKYFMMALLLGLATACQKKGGADARGQFGNFDGVTLTKAQDIEQANQMLEDSYNRACSGANNGIHPYLAPGMMFKVGVSKTQEVQNDKDEVSPSSKGAVTIQVIKEMTSNKMVKDISYAAYYDNKYSAKIFDNDSSLTTKADCKLPLARESMGNLGCETDKDLFSKKYREHSQKPGKTPECQTIDFDKESKVEFGNYRMPEGASVMAYKLTTTGQRKILCKNNKNDYVLKEIRGFEETRIHSPAVVSQYNDGCSTVAVNRENLLLGTTLLEKSVEIGPNGLAKESHFVLISAPANF